MRFLPPPVSLQDVAIQILDHGGDATNATKEFIDYLLALAVNAGIRPGDLLPVPMSAIEGEPPPLPDPIRRTYLASLAEHLARLAGHPAPPAWCFRPEYVLPEPRYPRYGSRERAIAETPEEFARRGLYCGPVLMKLHEHLRRRAQIAT